VLRLSFGVVTGLTLLALAACGAEASLPDQGECPEPSFGETDDVTVASYRTSVGRNLERIAGIEQTFRAAWPNRRLRERDAFRDDFARYAHLGRCTAKVIAGLSPPSPSLEEFHGSLVDFVERYIDALDEGGRAVASRNRSGYDRWVEDIDALRGEVTELSRTLGTLPRE
jgi:hypothetical protein